MQLATVLGNRRIRQTCSLREQVDYYQQDDEEEMAKKGKIEKNAKRARLIAFYAEKRAELSKIMKDPEATPDEKRVAQAALQRLPRDSSKVRYRNRCQMTGRPRAFIRKFGISRIAFREMSLEGIIPGVKKSSW